MFSRGAIADGRENGGHFASDGLEVAGRSRFSRREVEARDVDVAMGADVPLESRVLEGGLLWGRL